MENNSTNEYTDRIRLHVLGISYSQIQSGAYGNRRGDGRFHSLCL